MEYIDIFEQLQKRNVRYLICGGLAVNIYGIPRMTADIDLLLDFEEENIASFEAALKFLNYVASVPVALKSLVNKSDREKIVREKNMIVYSFYNSRSGCASLDVLIDVPLTFDELWKEREIRNNNNLNLNLVSLHHLIELKKYSNRKQDNDDIILLSKLLKK